MLSNPGDYADRMSGSVTEKFLSASRESYIAMIPIVFFTEDLVQSMHKDLRRCYMEGEGPTKYYHYN